MRTPVIGLTCLLMMVSNLFAETIRVPQDYTTILAAIKAAQNNDEIVVSPGVYVQTASLTISKKITLRSTFDGLNWDIIKNTIIRSNNTGFALVIISGTGVNSNPVIRGFTFTSDPVPADIHGYVVQRIGILGGDHNAVIEYNIIENCVYLGTQTGGWRGGAAINGVQGIIQNNIIHNSHADMNSAIDGCGGIIRNNLIYNDNGADVGVNTGGIVTFSNNTIYSTARATVYNPTYSSSKVYNNICWQKADGACDFGYNPRYCLVKGYTGPGNVITSDPKFVDPTKGDFRLQSTSPCIDAGMTTSTVNKADMYGVQRGLKGFTGVRGDGSNVDIGAFEYVPKPVSVWLPNGGPDKINAGDNLNVAWELDVPPAGTAIILQLYNGTAKVADIGTFWNANGADRSIVKLPESIPTRSTYTIRGVSCWNQYLYNDSLSMTINGLKNGVLVWTQYF